MKLCSACLLGIKCKYDGQSRTYGKVIDMLKDEVLVPVCPEQLGGLPTPREPAELIGNKVITVSGKDITKNCSEGAEEVLKLARLLNISEAILKQRSPSCGSGQIKMLSGEIIQGDGILTSFLKKNRISVTSEEDV